MRGILFTEPLYHKVVNGSKTQTRREGNLKEINKSPDDWIIYDNVTGEVGRSDYYVLLAKHNNSDNANVVKPLYKVGEVLYLKEPYLEDGLGTVIYKFDYDPSLVSHVKFKNKLFMPQKYARYFVKITGIRCERLFDISEGDCIREGIDIDKSPSRQDFFYDYQEDDYSYLTPQKSFFSLFRFANKIPKKKELSNDWLWVYDFVLCDEKGNKL